MSVMRRVKKGWSTQWSQDTLDFSFTGASKRYAIHHAHSTFIQPYLMLSYLVLTFFIKFCYSWPTYASKDSALVVKGVCCSPPRPPRTIVVLSLSNKLRKIICSSLFASPSSSFTLRERAGGAAHLQRYAVQSYTSFFSPLTRSITPNPFGSTRGWGSRADTPNTTYHFFPKRRSRFPLLSTLDPNTLTGTTL